MSSNILSSNTLANPNTPLYVNNVTGVTQLVAGTNVSLSPAGGTGVVTVNATSGGAGNFTSIVNSGTSTLTGAVNAGASVTAVGAIAGASVAATGAVTAGTVGCGVVNATTVNAVTVVAPNLSCPGSAVVNSLIVSNDITVNGGDLVMGQISGSAGQITAGPALTLPAVMELPPPSPTPGAALLTIAKEVVPVTKAWVPGATATNITFTDLNRWINDVKPHKFFIAFMSATTFAGPTLYEGSFDYYSWGASSLTRAPVTANYLGVTGAVTTTGSFPGPYALYFNWGGDPTPNTIYIYIKVIM